MTQATKNSHYIARHLTRAWEFDHPKKGRRHLWCYDFDRDAFDVVSSKHLYTTDAPWSDSVEAFLNRYVETPLAAFLKRYGESRREAEPSQIELRALKLAVLLQVERSGFNGDLQKTAQKDELALNTLVTAVDDFYRFVHVPLRKERLFFPETGVIMFPLVASHPAIALPLHPSYLSVMVPIPVDRFLLQIESLREDEDNFTALSAGFDSSRRVVIPGSLWGKHAEAELKGAICEARGRAGLLMKAGLSANKKLFGETMPVPFKVKAPAHK